MNASSSGRRAFTLVELMVVIGVVVLLMGMLLPSLATARHQAKRAKCVSNLRQLGVAFQVYFGRASETRGVTAYFPDTSVQWSGIAPLEFPVDSSMVATFKAFATTMFPGDDLYHQVHTYSFPGGRYWKTLGDGNSILNWDVSVVYSDLWGGVAGNASLNDANGNHITGTGDADGHGFANRPLNPFVFMGMKNMGNTSKGAEVFRCPEDTQTWQELGNSYAGNTRPDVNPLYNFQGQVVAYWKALNFTDIATVKYPARVVLAGDAGWRRSARNDGAPWMCWHQGNFYYNVVFLDGHVAFLRVTPGQTSGPDWTLDAGGS